MRRNGSCLCVETPRAISDKGFHLRTYASRRRLCAIHSARVSIWMSSQIHAPIRQRSATARAHSKTRKVPEHLFLSLSRKSDSSSGDNSLRLLVSLLTAANTRSGRGGSVTRISPVLTEIHSGICFFTLSLRPLAANELNFKPIGVQDLFLLTSVKPASLPARVRSHARERPPLLEHLPTHSCLGA